jgi:hypothetical protein
MRWKERMEGEILELRADVAQMDSRLKRAECDHINRRFKEANLWDSRGTPWQEVCLDCGKILRYFETEHDYLEAQKAAYEERIAAINAKIRTGAPKEA